MEKSIAAAKIDKLRAAVNKSKKNVYNVGKDKINLFKIVASFPSIKEKIDRNNVQQAL